VAAQFLLGIEELVINPELKRAFGAGYEGEAFDKMLIVLEDVIRRTDGSFAIVSRHAVF
jgi:hypothetical protein